MIRSEFQVECDLCKQIALKIINQNRRDQNQERAAQLAWANGWAYNSGDGDWSWYCPRCVPRAEEQGIKVRLSPFEEE